MFQLGLERLQGEAANQVELARFGGIHPMQISHTMKTLESEAFVSRKRSLEDVRAKHVEMTRKGLAVLCRALPMVIGVQQRLFGDEGRPGGAFLKALILVDCTGADQGLSAPSE